MTAVLARVVAAARASATPGDEVEEPVAAPLG
jgi:hypothetical protein